MQDKGLYFFKDLRVKNLLLDANSELVNYLQSDPKQQTPQSIMHKFECALQIAQAYDRAVVLYKYADFLTRIGSNTVTAKDYCFEALRILKNFPEKKARSLILSLCC